MGDFVHERDVVGYPQRLARALRENRDLMHLQLVATAGRGTQAISASRVAEAAAAVAIARSSATLPAELDEISTESYANASAGEARSATPRPQGGTSIARASSEVPLFDRPPGERRFLVGDRATRQDEANVAKATIPTQRPQPPQITRVRAGDVSVRRAPAPTPTPTPAKTTTVTPMPIEIARRNSNSMTDAVEEDDASARFALLELD